MAPKAKASRADLLEKEPSDMHTALADYIKSQTGYEADARTVQLVTVLRKSFQKSDEHQNAITARKDERAAATAERASARAAKKAAAPAKKTAAKKTTAKKGATSKAAKKAAAATEDPF